MLAKDIHSSTDTLFETVSISTEIVLPILFTLSPYGHHNANDFDKNLRIIMPNRPIQGGIYDHLQ